MRRSKKNMYREYGGLVHNGFIMNPTNVNDESRWMFRKIPESFPFCANRSRKGETCTQTDSSSYVLLIGAFDGAIFDKHEQIRRDRCK